MRFGEGKLSRCILVYSGIHYDRVAFSLSDAPYVVSHLPPEMDQTVWETTDDAVLAQAQRLVEQLHEAHYYDDPAEMVLACKHPGCGWVGSGQQMGAKHALSTGHTALVEIEDVG